jgi:hypothetical protein
MSFARSANGPECSFKEPVCICTSCERHYSVSPRRAQWLHCLRPGRTIKIQSELVQNSPPRGCFGPVLVEFSQEIASPVDQFLPKFRESSIKNRPTVPLWGHSWREVNQKLVQNSSRGLFWTSFDCIFVSLAEGNVADWALRSETE